MLVAVRGIVVVVNYAILMPLIASVLNRYLEAKRKDFRLSQVCGALATVGFAVTALAPSPIVLVLGLVALSLGSAIAVASRSLVTSFVAEDQVGTLYSAASVMTSVGSLSAGPVFAYVFKLGLYLGANWSGLPFLLAAVLFAASLAAFSCIRLGP